MLLVNSQLTFDRYHLVNPLVPCQYDSLERKQNEGIGQRHDTSEAFPGNMADHVQISTIDHHNGLPFLKHLSVRTPGSYK